MKLTYLDENKPWQEQDLGGKRRSEKTCCIVRYGAFGDLIQASSVFPALKEEGYYITVNTSERGVDILKTNPFVDEIFTQKTNQVPNEELGEYWEKLSVNFDKFINLSESVERALIAHPADQIYYATQFEIHKKMNVNYFERTHELAGVPFRKDSKFYPSGKEIKEARKFLDRIGRNKKKIMWVLSGSSVHKYYPHMDVVIQNLLNFDKDLQIILSGDIACQVLEFGWEKEPRVHKKSGRWNIRKSLTVSQMVDCVVGTETGVLNSVAYDEVAKVIMLSHSSIENLTKHWNNTDSITPEMTPCYPCHKMHYGFDTCNRENDAAMCANRINPRKVFESIIGKVYANEFNVSAAMQ